MKFLCIPLRRVITTIVCSCLLLVLSQCKEEQITDPSPSVPNPSLLDPTLDMITKMGFSREEIVDYGKFYLVEGDIRFWKTLNQNKGARPIQKATTQYKLASFSNVVSITVRVENNFPNSTFRQKVINATQTAISRWNNIGSAVNFTYTTNSSATITVQYESNLPDDQYGAADYPVECEVGPLLGISTNAGGLTQDRMNFILMHELGHTIGHAHTNQTVLAFQIFGTPVSDIASIMQSGGADGVTTNPNSVPTRSTFTTGDQNATRFLFPAGGPTVDAVNDTQDGSGLPIRITWTPSNFCSFSVNIDVYDGELLVKQASSTFNDGLHNFATSGLTSGTTYEIKVYPPGNPSNVISTSTSFTF